MANTRILFSPLSAEFPASNFPQLLLVNRRPVLGFDASTSETCYWTAVAPQGLTGTLVAVVNWKAASATSGDVDWDVAVEAVTSADALDLDATTSFDTVNSTDNTSVPATAGYMLQTSVTLTNADSIAAGDYFRISLTRDVADTATGDIYVLAVEIRDDN